MLRGLSRGCRRYRAELPQGAQGADHPHRRSCPECAAFAAAMDKASAVRLPLPERMRERLRSIPATEGEGLEPRLRMPALSMPPHLRSRLRDLPRQASVAGEPPPRELPVWVRSSRYAVAASYLLAVLAMQLLGDPLELGRKAAGSLSQELRQVWQKTGTEIEIPLERLEDGVSKGAEGVTERYDATREALSTSVEDLKSRVTEMTRGLFPDEP